MGRAARSYAESAFEMGAIAGRFEAILREVVPESSIRGGAVVQHGRRTPSQRVPFEGDFIHPGGAG